MRIPSVKCFFFAVIMLLLGYAVHAQRKPMQYGKVGRADLEMTHYEADSTAHAVILGDYGSVSYDYDNARGFLMNYHRHIRVKVFNSNAFSVGDFKLPLHGKGVSGERIKALRGVTYNLDKGKVVKTSINHRQGFEEEVHSSLRTLNLSMPALQEGSVFELEYTLVSPYLFNLPSWYFQNAYPVVFSEFRTHVPEYFVYKPLMQGYLPVSHQESFKRRNRIRLTYYTTSKGNASQQHTEDVEFDETFTLYRIEQAPAFGEEPYMNARINYVSQIMHELMLVRFPQSPVKDYSSTWPSLNKQLMESDAFGRQLQRSGFLSGEVARIKEGAQNKQELIQKAFETIQREMHWNKLNSLYVGSTLRKAWGDKMGNSADINLLLVLLLRELDIDAHPVILSTRSHGMVNPAQIMLNQYNYAIAAAQVDGKLILMDATDKHVPYYLLPERCINGDGRLISERGSSPVPLLSQVHNTVQTLSRIEVKPCGHMLIELKRSKENYPRLQIVNRMNQYSDREDFIVDLETRNSGLDLLSFEVDNLDDWSEPLRSTYQFEVPAQDDLAKDLIMVNPIMIDRLQSNPFRLENREFPVDFIYPFQHTQHVLLLIPEGYELAELPSDVSYQLPGQAGSMAYRYSHADGVVRLEMLFQVDKSIFVPAEYRSLREFYGSRVISESRPVVLRKQKVSSL